MSYQPARSSSRSIVAAGALLALVGIFWLVYRNAGSPSLPQPSIALFRSELSGIAAPPGSTEESPTDESVRIGSIQVTNRYLVPLSAADARAAFQAQLTGHGWQYKGGSDGPLWIDSYCKPPLAAKLELLRSTDTTSSVALSVSWNETTLLKCGGGTTP